MNVTWPYNADYAQSGWTRGTTTTTRLDAVRSEEAIRYELSPLAHLQWRGAVEWAEAHGAIEVALHGVGDPATRRLCYFACGRQRASAGLCETLPSGIDEIARDAAAANLRMLCQVHHHPRSVQHRSDRIPPRFFLSGTDMNLLGALARDLASGVMLFEPTHRRGSMALRAGAHMQLRADGRRFELAVEPGTRLIISGGEREALRGIAEVFVAVTGSDGELHGKVLRSEVCSDCGNQIERSLHPLELEVTANFDARYLGRAFDPEAWAEELDEKVQRYCYATPRAARRTTRTNWWRPGTRTTPAAQVPACRSEPSSQGDDVGGRLIRWLDVLEGAVDDSDDRVTSALAELRSLAEDVAALAATPQKVHVAHAGGEECDYDDGC
ncbi:MAG TPA: hypothetical protein ENN42_03470 [Thioalkalivibrio sp.]|nr:hypothetical protein [Thioalkalivibrio sp.]